MLSAAPPVGAWTCRPCVFANSGAVDKVNQTNRKQHHVRAAASRVGGADPDAGMGNPAILRRSLGINCDRDGNPFPAEWAPHFERFERDGARFVAEFNTFCWVRAWRDNPVAPGRLAGQYRPR